MEKINLTKKNDKMKSLDLDKMIIDEFNTSKNKSILIGRLMKRLPKNIKDLMINHSIRDMETTEIETLKTNIDKQLQKTKEKRMKKIDKQIEELIELKKKLK